MSYTSRSTDLEKKSNTHALLHIDLGAIARNYQTLKIVTDDIPCGACVKANAYGLGQEQVAKTLWQAGCQDFFVAYPGGGARLRKTLPEARIHVFSGPLNGTEDVFDHFDLIPVLNSLEQIAAWNSFNRERNKKRPADIHMDTGMSRLGLTEEDVTVLSNSASLVEDMNIDIVMSHLTSAEDESNFLNLQQLEAFSRLSASVPCKRRSLANSSGIFLGPEYHFDIVRPGAALYGVNPTPHRKSPIESVIRLQGQIIQIRKIDSPQSVGYGATYCAKSPTTVATVGIGYGDGYPRLLSGRGNAYISGMRVPVIGRVSMDLMTVDVTEIPDDVARVGAYVDLIGNKYTIDDAGRDAQSIGYEILTSLGGRFHRLYHNGDVV